MLVTNLRAMAYLSFCPCWHALAAEQTAGLKSTSITPKNRNGMATHDLYSIEGTCPGCVRSVGCSCLQLNDDDGFLNCRIELQADSAGDEGDESKQEGD